MVANPYKVVLLFSFELKCRTRCRPQIGNCARIGGLVPA